MPVKIVFSNLPAIARAIPEKEEEAVDNFSEELMTAIRTRIWRRYGYTSASVKDHSLDPLSADIHIGERGALGFYSRFQEEGTVNQPPRPVVRPVAHLFEPRFAVIVAAKLKEAVRAK
jgi:hypothetical protein